MHQLVLIAVTVGIAVLAIHISGARAEELPPQAPETEPAPLSLAVHSINNFAGDLYRHLAQENEQHNLFFSPYSLSSALTMVVEGARGETARQMGAVLRFPCAAQRTGNEAQALPWNTPLMHTGMAALRQRLTGGVSAEAAREMRDKITALEQEHQALAKHMHQLSESRQWQEQFAVSQRAANVAGELNRLRQQIDQYELAIANALWGEQTFPFRPQFTETLHDAYGAAAFPVDFIHDFEAVRDRINRWVEEQTHKRIKSPLGPGTLSPATRLVLANAIYFKGNWAEPFPKANSYEGDFTTPDGTTAKVRFMAARGARFRYAELLADGTRNEPVLNLERREYNLKPNEDGFQVLELPYRGHTLSMLVLLPKSPEGLAALEKRLTADNLHRWIEALHEQKVHVFLPKFKLETR